MLTESADQTRKREGSQDDGKYHSKFDVCLISELQELLSVT